MQAVILAAGRGTRMGDLTTDRPKPMLEVAGKTLLQHKFDAMPETVSEIIIVVGYLADTIKNAYGDSYAGKKITYVTQGNIVGGTADALWQAKAHLTGSFLVLNGDDIYSSEDLKNLASHEWAMLVQPVPDTSVGGRVLMNPDGTVADVVEGGEGEGFVNANTFALDTRLFDFPQVAKAAGSTEMGLPQTIVAASKAANIPCAIVEATSWTQITNPDDITAANEAFGKTV